MSRLLTATALGAVLAAGAFAAQPAQAAVIATLSFDTPTGIIDPTDSVDVFLTLALDPDSDAVTTDSSGRITSGFTDDDITALGGDPSNPEGTTYINVFYGCGDTFGGCGSEPYAFDFYVASPDGELIAPTDLDLQPGGSITYLFGRFTPSGGSAYNGTYSFFNAGVTFNWITPSMTQPFSKTIAQTCPAYEASCAFTRTVVGGLDAPVGIPEPSAWALMIAGFGGAGAVLRRRRTAAA